MVSIRALIISLGVDWRTGPNKRCFWGSLLWVWVYKNWGMVLEKQERQKEGEESKMTFNLPIWADSDSEGYEMRIGE